jgi:steroid 5-alpha reductase family enzyme
LSGYSFADFLVVSATCLGAVVLLMVLTAVLARSTGRVSVVDTIWGLGFIVVTVTAVLTARSVSDASASGDHNDRAWFLVAMVVIWGGRLAAHIAKRSHGGGEDPRYEELMGGNGGLGHLVKKVLLPQGLAIWFVSLPIQVTVLSRNHVGPVMYLGVVLWALGMVFESIGDAQLAAYKRDPDRGPVMDRGLWRYTRHPNYFGDACVWWGVYLVCASSWPGVLTILSPLAMTYFLVFATGARLLERTMMQRDGYPEYAARTSMFFPLPPRR